MPEVAEQPQIEPQTALQSIGTVTTTSGTVLSIKRPAKQRRRYFQPQDIANMAELIAKGCNETEACARLGFNYDSWLNWKVRAKNQVGLNDMVKQLNAQIITTCVNGIEKAGLKDWRALRERLSLLDRERFGNQVSQPAPATVNVFAQIGLDVTRLIQDGYKTAQEAKALTVQSEVKLLTEPGQSKT